MPKKSLPHPPVSPQSGRPVAVIDIGTTAIRMTVAHIGENGAIHIIDSLEQAVSLGKDTFTKGYIAKSTIEDSVKVLKSFRRILDEYNIASDDQIRVVATTAVREASNRDAFVDRISIANGFYIATIEDTEIARLEYLGIRSFLEHHSLLKGVNQLVVEVGGGTIELLLLEEGNVAFSQSYNVGSLRLREMLEVFGAPVTSRRELMDSHINRTISQIKQSVPDLPRLIMVGIGGDLRFAYRQLDPAWKPDKPGRISCKGLANFIEKINTYSVNELVQKYHLTFPEAETVGPALLFYLHLARAFDQKKMLVADVSIRHGMLMEMASHGAWVDNFREQVIRSAFDIGHRYRFDEAHARFVAEICMVLFKALQDEHRLKPWNGALLYVAALLHDIGLFVSTRSHHKHSMYLIQNSELFGLNAREILMVALIARYHRRAAPKPVHEEYAMLDREGRIAVAKMGAILRVADALDRSHSQRSEIADCRKEGGSFSISINTADDLAIEQMALQTKGPMFEDVYGLRVVLRKQGTKAE
jgi:exopolyphosphatase/guanosine-5'-triphosphate,3'-diphosphate pyrophosphatase